MTLSIEPSRRYTVEEYLDLEGRSSDRKCEYRDGLIVDMREAMAMAGGSESHCLINANVIAALSNRLKGGPCRVYSNDLRIRIPRKTLYTFPDAVVICGKTESEQHKTAGITVTNPTVIVEILSPSTELYDRGDKFSRYREIPSLREYVLVSQSAPRIETYYRHDDGGWRFGPFEGLGEVAKLISLGIDLPLAEVFAGIEFPAETQP